MIRNKNTSTTTTNVATKKVNNSEYLVPVALTESIHGHEIKCANTEYNDKKQDGTLRHIRTIKHQYLQKNYKIITKSDSDEIKRDKMSDAMDENTKEKKLRIINSSIKVYIFRSLVLLNLSILNSIKQNLLLSTVSSMLDPTKHNSQSSPYQTQQKRTNIWLALLPIVSLLLISKATMKIIMLLLQ